MTIENNRITDATNVANKKTNEELKVPAQPVGRPLVPASFVPIAGGAALIFGAIGMLPIVPQPWGGLVSILAFVAAILAGLGGKQPAVAAGNPVVPLAAVPALGAASGVLYDLAQKIPQDGFGDEALTVAAMVAAWAAGKALPAPTK